MSNKNKKDIKQVEPTGLSSFLSNLNQNMGFSLDKNEKKKDFNPYSVENVAVVKEVYNVMNSYKEKIKSDSLLIPKDISTNQSGKKIKIEFDTDINKDALSEVIEESGFDNVIIPESSNRIDIIRNKE